LAFFLSAKSDGYIDGFTSSEAVNTGSEVVDIDGFT
jgi:hypothetical protein